MADKDQENGHGLFQVVPTLFSPGFLLTTHHHHLPHPVPRQTRPPPPIQPPLANPTLGLRLIAHENAHKTAHLPTATTQRPG
ncbi:uncharacterized protein LACBIDRAFT_296790 [Laccaria bicolor S238N-H82]|uniref:Predicted protein n=1 Tax=Laccaria bicolor (strain S238N-H82 / ATCC MYA-4686) TaxID=486041 RepID=B0E339_LACBS|nr:uncharacterized protein LACBIDRAFT_296790 [Laccaria bicolor S238N-H82]EDQ98739.1 predicted protein [Laccaria bicolor S238N-H82]|eukprot:XP_001890616.1 predicted protein [Laccaria bicolor S238N-H82]